jgi:Cu(I)/Ag(I) efflux system membrane protein CusA/SilA
MSIGVWVGLIALMGVDAETGVFMLLYSNLAYDRARREGRLRSLATCRQPSSTAPFAACGRSS